MPLHDEAARVEALLARVLPWAREPGRELVLVDDGSSDGTRERLQAFQAAHPELLLQVLSQPASGKGGAVRSGMLAARGAQVVFTDADLPFGLVGVEAVFAALETAPAAVGARDLPGSRVGPTPLLRRVASQVFRAWVSLVLDTGPVRDTQCGLKGFRRELIAPLFEGLACRDFAFDLELLGLCAARGIEVARVPVAIEAWETSTVVLRRAAPALLLGSLRAARAVRARSGQPSPGRLERWLPLLVALFAFVAMIHGLDRWGGRDWDQLQADLIAARRSLLQGEVPLWMPYRLGGHDALADPSSLWCSPLGLLVLLFGPSWGVRVFAGLAAGLTAWGALSLGRALGLDAPGRAASALLLAAAPPLGLAMAAGVPTFSAGIAVLPWLTLCLVRGGRGHLLLAGALLALDLFAGDVNHFVFHAVWTALVALALAIAQRAPRRLAGVALVGIASAVFAAPKLVPMALLAREHPRLTEDRRGALTWTLLGHALLDRGAVRFVERPWHEFVVLERGGGLVRSFPLEIAPERVVPGTAVDWADTAHYLGPLGLGLALLGLARGGPGRRARLAILAAALPMLWLGFGRNATPSAWDTLHALPVFSSLRSPARLTLYPWFALALLAGAGLDLAYAWLVGRRARAVAFVLIGVIVADVAPPAWRAYRSTFTEPDPALAPGPFATHALTVPQGSSYYGPPVAPSAAAGLAVANGYGAVPVAPTAVPVEDRARYRGEAFFLAGKGSVSALAVGSREIVVDVVLARRDRLVVNQSWARGWSLVEPGDASLLRHDDGRLAVELPADATRAVFRYTSPGLGAGLLLFILGGAALPFLAARWPA